MDKPDLIFGRWPVKEALSAGKVLKLFLSGGSHGGVVDDIVNLAKGKGIPLHWMDRARMDEMVGEEHQGVVAQTTPLRFLSLDALIEASLKAKHIGPSLIFLDGITDPHNLGSILRSAYFFGGPGIVIPKWRSASVTGTVVKASAGAAHLLAMTQVANLGTAMEAARKKGLWLAGADMDGIEIKKADVPRPFALVLGSEGEGLHNLIKEKCDLIVSIRRLAKGPGVESLNVSNACAILLHQFS